MEVRKEIICILDFQEKAEYAKALCQDPDRQWEGKGTDMVWPE